MGCSTCAKRVLFSLKVLSLLTALCLAQQGVLLNEEDCGEFIGPNEEPFTVPYRRETGEANIIAFKVAGEVIRLYNNDATIEKPASRYNLQNFRVQRSPPDEPDLTNYYMKIKLRHKEFVHIKVSQYNPGTDNSDVPFLRWLVTGFSRKQCICAETPDCTIPKGAFQ